MATQADRIRHFVLDHYITPARGKGHSTVTIRAGDVHREMCLANAMPAVCGAIGTKKFEEFAGVSAIERTGPAQGANVYFRFSPNFPLGKSISD
jgi:5-methylcytosine-specific restriction protein B